MANPGPVPMPDAAKLQKIYELLGDPEGDGCRIWPMAWNGAGYGVVWYQQRVQQVHKIMYEDAFGQVPMGLQIDHLCRNRGCANVFHLEAVTQGENIRRGESRAYQKAKTHCPLGHPLAEGNLIPSQLARGWRSCLTCEKMRTSNRNRKKLPTQQSITDARKAI